MGKFKISNTLKLKYLKKKGITLSESDMITFLNALENPPPANERLKAAMLAHQDMLKDLQ
jgi:uncharacterized protein (DUF1778 family)